MIEIKARGIPLFQFKSFQVPNLFHGVFTRKGGISPEPWNSLNLGGTVGDNPDYVQENLTRLLNASGFSQNQLVQVKQIHSAKVVVADKAADVLEEGDAMTTDREGLLLLMRYADCVPILFFDPEHLAIAIAHAGWMGTLNGVVSEVVRVMMSQYGTAPDKLLVGIGPSIGPDHYQIGDDVIIKTKEAFPDVYEQILNQDQDQVTLDLWKANQIHLMNMGVNQIEISEICTGCDQELWYSHRAEFGKTGRFAAVIGLL
jgi:YfiH family protein